MPKKPWLNPNMSSKPQFSTQLNHQAPLEPEVTVCYMEGKGDDAELVIIGRSINIHPNAAAIAEAVGWKKTRYIEAFSGGQFGQKSSIITEALAAAACVHFRRPIRYVPSLAESMFLSPKRHPYYMKCQDGRRQRRALYRPTTTICTSTKALISCWAA